MQESAKTYPNPDLTPEERRAYDYLRMASGQSIADWAYDLQNGTWVQALELTSKPAA